MNYLNNEIYNLKSSVTNYKLKRPISTVNNSLKCLRYAGPKMRNIIPPDIRNSENIEEFTRKIKCWTCKLCLNYVHRVLYVN